MTKQIRDITREDIDVEDEKVAKYQILGKVMHDNAEGLAKLEREEPAQEKRRGEAFKDER